jgi:hypothetical protein
MVELHAQKVAADAKIAGWYSEDGIAAAISLFSLVELSCRYDICHTVTTFT